MRHDSSDAPTPRGAARFGWLPGLLPRPSHGRVTRVDDLPQHIIDDIGLHQHVVDALLRHRR